jgi:ubiquinone/menaquinone biosynthesis C-methylase UbiE
MLTKIYNQDFVKNIIICVKCKNNKIFLKNKYYLCKQCNEQYPVVYGIPILISKSKCNDFGLNYHKKNIEMKILMSKEFQLNKFGVLKYIEKILLGTSGILYENIKNLKYYPIADIPFAKLVKNKNKLLLDIGCGWGRWTINAAQKGYHSIGIDKSLSSLIAAKIIAEKLKIKNCHFICCDVTELPLKKEIFNKVFSFSFLQHFSENNLKIILQNISYKIKKNGEFKTQIINKYSLRGLYNLFKIKYFRNKMIKEGRIDKREDENNFTVRYFSIFKNYKIFSKYFFVDKLDNYSFFTQAQFSDFKIFSLKFKFYLLIANAFNLISKYIFFFKYFSDNVLLTLKKNK